MLEGLFDRLDLFSDLSSIQNDLLRPLFSLSYEPAGTMIFQQGDLAESLYLVLEGEVNIRYKPDDGSAIILTRIRPEGVVGWSAALGSPAYTSSAVCATDCSLLRLRGEDLRKLCENHPETGAIILERLAAIVAERLRATHPQVVALLEKGIQNHKSVEAD